MPHHICKMNEYYPDKWLVVKLTDKAYNNKTHYRVFAVWYGGLASSDSWKLNSGITQVSEDGDYYLFNGTSGSVYRCDKKSYGTSAYGRVVLNGLINNASDFTVLEVLPDTTDFIDKDYNE